MKLLSSSSTVIPMLLVLIVHGLGRIDLVSAGFDEGLRGSALHPNDDEITSEDTITDESPAPSIAPSQEPTQAPVVGWNVITEDDFDNGSWGNFIGRTSNGRFDSGEHVEHHGSGALCIYKKSWIGLLYGRDVTGFSNLRVSLEYDARNMTGKEGFSVEYSSDPHIWKRIKKFTGNGLQNVTVDFNDELRRNRQLDLTQDARIRVKCQCPKDGIVIIDNVKFEGFLPS